MAHRSPMLAVTVTALTLAAIFSATAPRAFAADSPSGYSNHTVGGGAGWLFNYSSNSSATDYSTWAKSRKFFLGDYLSTRILQNPFLLNRSLKDPFLANFPPNVRQFSTRMRTRR